MRLFFLLNVIIDNDHWLVRQLEATPESLAKPYLWWQLLTYGFAMIRVVSGTSFGTCLDYGCLVALSKAFTAQGVSAFLPGQRAPGRTLLDGAGVGHDCRRVGGVGGRAGGGRGGNGGHPALLYPLPEADHLVDDGAARARLFVGAMIIAGNIFGSLSGVERVAFDVHLVGAVFAICYYRFGWNLGVGRRDCPFRPACSSAGLNCVCTDLPARMRKPTSTTSSPSKPISFSKKSTGRESTA